MRLEPIRTFVLTVELGSISAAARALGIGRATMYRRMARLGLAEKTG